MTWAPLSPGSRYFVATEMFIEGLFDVIVMLGGAGNINDTKDKRDKTKVSAHNIGDNLVTYKYV